MAFNELQKKRRKRSARYHSKFRNKLYFINFSTNNQREEETKVEHTQLVIFFLTNFFLVFSIATKVENHELYATCCGPTESIRSLHMTMRMYSY